MFERSSAKRRASLPPGARGGRRLTAARLQPKSGGVRAQLVRTAVLEIYEDVRREGARADQALQRVLRREKALRSVERRAVSDAGYGLLRPHGRADHLLGKAPGTRGSALAKLATPTQHFLR